LSTVSVKTNVRVPLGKPPTRKSLRGGTRRLAAPPDDLGNRRRPMRRNPERDHYLCRSWWRRPSRKLDTTLRLPDSHTACTPDIARRRDVADAAGRWRRQGSPPTGLIAADMAKSCAPPSRCQLPSCGSTVGAAADLEFHPVGVPKEQRPLIAQPLDGAHLLCTRGGQALFERLERAVRIDGKRVVVDGAAPALPAPVADDLVRRNLEDVERGPATEVEDLHPGVVLALRNFEGHHRVERLLIEVDGQVHVGRKRRHMVEAVREGHGKQCTGDVR